MSKLLNVLEKYVNPASRLQTPLVEDFERVSDFDENGNEIVNFVPISYPDRVKSLGSSENWKLTALLKAGINPAFGIRTGFNSRLDGFDHLSSSVDQLNSVATELENIKNNVAE